jgi:hypothetical protein
MMSSAREHHAKAEQLLDQAHAEQDSVRRHLILAEAQVHATLALSAPAGKGPPGPGQDEAADTQSTGTAYQSLPSPSPGTPTPAHPGEPPSEPYPGYIKVTGHRLPSGQEPVRPVAPAAPAGFVRTWPDPESAADNPSPPVTSPVTGQPGPGDPGKEEPGDLDDQELRGPEEQKPGGFRPF